ncbi:MAG: hypothetical protein BWY56_01393 [Acidobacteria bacterium ADurb.Bin340]|nr:MAG: hypothetical protein BWY56_01393 [Acidobacteria bacterium ADurb.Bin340]
MGAGFHLDGRHPALVRRQGCQPPFAQLKGCRAVEFPQVDAVAEFADLALLLEHHAPAIAGKAPQVGPVPEAVLLGLAGPAGSEDQPLPTVLPKKKDAAVPGNVLQDEFTWDLQEVLHPSLEIDLPQPPAATFLAGGEPNGLPVPGQAAGASEPRRRQSAGWAALLPQGHPSHVVVEEGVIKVGDGLARRGDPGVADPAIAHDPHGADGVFQPTSAVHRPHHGELAPGIGIGPLDFRGLAFRGQGSKLGGPCQGSGIGEPPGPEGDIQVQGQFPAGSDRQELGIQGADGALLQRVQGADVQLPRATVPGAGIEQAASVRGEAGPMNDGLPETDPRELGRGARGGEAQHRQRRQEAQADDPGADAEGLPTEHRPSFGGRLGAGSHRATGHGEVFQGEGQVVGRVEAGLRLLGQTVVQEPLQGRWYLQGGVQGRRVVPEGGTHAFHGGSPLEGAPARHHFEEDDAQGEDVGAAVGVLASDLLGAHVTRSAHEVALHRQDQIPGIRRGEVGRQEDRGFGVEEGRLQFRESEIQDLGPPIQGDEDVFRFEIPVDDAPAVGGREAVCDLKGDLDGLAHRHGQPSHALPEGPPFQQFRYQVGLSLVGAQIVDGQDVGVVQGAGGLGFLLEAFQPFRIYCEGGQKHLEGHPPAQARIQGSVDSTHAPASQAILDRVGTQARAGCEAHAADSMIPILTFREHGTCACLIHALRFRT